MKFKIKVDTAKMTASQVHAEAKRLRVLADAIDPYPAVVREVAEKPCFTGEAKHLAELETDVTELAKASSEAAVALDARVERLEKDSVELAKTLDSRNRERAESLGSEIKALESKVASLQEFATGTTVESEGFASRIGALESQLVRLSDDAARTKHRLAKLEPDNRTETQGFSGA